jgi:hypothetical protein
MDNTQPSQSSVPKQEPMRSGAQASAANQEVSPHRNKNRKLKQYAIIIGIIVLVGMTIFVIMQILAKAPKDVVADFIKASQKRDVVDTDIFLDSQSQQRYAIVYKIPPKSFDIKRTILEENTAIVEVEWTTIDSSRGYVERTELVSFTLTKVDRSWKLNDIKNGNVLDFNFLFGT